MHYAMEEMEPADGDKPWRADKRRRRPKLEPEPGVPTVRITLAHPKVKQHSVREGHAQPAARRRPTVAPRRSSPPTKSASPVQHDREWSPYSHGGNTEWSPEKSLSPAPAAATTAPRPAADVLASLAIVAPNYDLPPLFRDALPPDMIEENAAGRQGADTTLSQSDIEEAWEAARSESGDTSSSVPHRIYRRVLSLLWPELPPTILDVALARQADAGAPEGPLERARFVWLARYLGHFEQLWFLCECMEEYEDIPLTPSEFQRGCTNVGEEVQRRQAVKLTKQGEPSAGVLGFCSWLAAYRCHEARREAAEAAEEEEQVGQEQGAGGAEDETSRQLFAGESPDASASPPPDRSAAGTADGTADGAPTGSRRKAVGGASPAANGHRAGSHDPAHLQRGALHLSKEAKLEREVSNVFRVIAQQLRGRRSLYGHLMVEARDAFQLIDKDGSTSGKMVILSRLVALSVSLTEQHHHCSRPRGVPGGAGADGPGVD